MTSSFAFEPPVVTTVPVSGGGNFPVRRIYCVGRNYEAHAREMGFEIDREEPFFFLKPGDAVELDGAQIPYPRMTGNYHYEVELVVAIGKAGAEIPIEKASSHIFGYAVGLDMTRRDVQITAREKGRPWDMGKAFDRSAPIGQIVPVANWNTAADAAITLDVNGERKQGSKLSKLIWSVDEIIYWLSRYMDLVPGDLIYTGTPEGVGPVVSGDILEARIEGLPQLRISVT